MKTLRILLVFVAVTLLGFSIDSQTGGNAFLKKGTKEGVVVPLKFKGVIIPNLSAVRTSCSGGGDHARYGNVQGNQTHGGVLITEESTYEIINCSTVGYTNYAQITGKNTVANGDYYNYTCNMTIDLATGFVKLDINISGGSGRFEGVTGNAVLTGYQGENDIPVSGDGTITFPK
jgi:hypothetical protein